MRPENKAMQKYLADNGVKCRVKYIAEGSLKGTWRLADSKQAWTPYLRTKLIGLEFKGYDGGELHEYSGNGGMFMVFVRVPEYLTRKCFLRVVV